MTTTRARRPASGRELPRGPSCWPGFSRLPGFGPDKSRIFLALLGKQYGVQPPGWREAAGHFGEAGSHCSVADITDEASLAEVRAYKQGLKAAARAGT